MIKTKDIEAILKLHAINNQAVLIWGRPGVGKTEEITRIGKTYWPHFISMNGTQMAYEAIQGLNYKSEDGMKNHPYPAIKLLEELHDQKVFVFIDELSSLAQDDQRSLLNIINERITPNGIELTGEIMFVLAGNPSADQKGFASANADAAVNLVEQAIYTRCAVYAIDYKVRDYLDYAPQANIHLSIVESLTRAPEIFDAYKNDSDDGIQDLTPRTLNRLSETIWNAQNNKIELTPAIFESFVGNSATIFYEQYVNDKDKYVDFELLINGDKASRAVYDALDSTQKGAIMANGFYRNKVLKIDFTKYDAIFYELLQGLSPEYVLTIAHLQAKNYGLVGPKSMQFLGDVRETIMSED